MTITIPEVAAARPDGLIRSSSEIGRAATDLGNQVTRQHATLESLRARWQGRASAAAISCATPTLAQMLTLHRSLTRLQGVLDSSGRALATSRANLLQTVSRLTSQGWQVAPDGGVSVRPGSELDRFARSSPANAMTVAGLAATDSTIVKSMLAAFDTADRHAGQSIQGAVSVLSGQTGRTWSGAPLTPKAPPGEEIAIPRGKDQVQIKDWWGSLTEDQRQQVIAAHPGEIGNLNGVPVWARSKANRIVVQQDIERVEQRAAVLGVTVDQIRADPERYHLTGTDVTRYTNAVQVRSGLEANTNTTGGVPTYLYVYEPEAFGGQGRAAVAIGDPDTADNTTVVVPGTGNSVTSGWLSGPDAANVYNETHAADPSKSNAVVAWMGYNAPDGMSDPQVGQTGLAREGGHRLARDVNAFDVTHRAGDGHTTVMGHSYGSTTVADAAAGYGMRVDDVVLIGSPGTDLAATAADFHLPPDGQVYVGAASTDPVTQFGDNGQIHIPGTDVTIALGADPADLDFGGTRFKAEVDGFTDPISDHSGYLTPGSESLYAVADIASGHSDLLDDHDMIAPRRYTVDVPLFPGPDVQIDPELLRLPTGGHYH